MNRENVMLALSMFVESVVFVVFSITMVVLLYIVNDLLTY